MTEQPNNSDLVVCFWNILHNPDGTYRYKTQLDRLPGIINTLKKLPRDTIIGLAEVEHSSSKLLSKHLVSNTKFFVEHNSRKDYIGVTSQLELAPRFIEISSNCRAVITHYKGISIVIVHMTFGVFIEALHKRQIKTLLSKLDSKSPVVIMGDFNSMAWQSSRKLLRKMGFSSAIKRSLLRRLPTVPSRQYRRLYPEPYKTLCVFGFAVDDIYIRGMNVVDFGIFEGESDHLGVWARLR